MMKSVSIWALTSSLAIAILATSLPCSAADPSPTVETIFPSVPVPAADKIIDLTHVLGPDLPDFHLGSTAFSYKMLFTIPKDGFADGAFTTPEHYSTHMDAPSHFVEGGQTIDRVPASKLILPSVVIDVRDEVKADPNYRLTVEKIKDFEASGPIPEGCAVLLLTGWSERFRDPTAYRNVDSTGTMRYPSYGAEAAEYLAKTRKVAALGLDTISADYGLSKDYPVHKIALGQGVLLIENLNNLDKLPARGALTFFGPLRVKDGTGSPARVLAIIP